MASTADHIAATRDMDLLARFRAKAEQLGVDNAQAFAESRIGALVSADIADGQSVADVLAFAHSQYEPTPRPGENPTYITDAHLAVAINAVRSDSASGT